MTLWAKILMICLVSTNVTSHIFHLWHNNIPLELHRNETMAKRYMKYSDGTMKYCVSINLKPNVIMYLTLVIECIEVFQLRANCQHAKTEFFHRARENRKRHCRHVVPGGGLFQTMDNFEIEFIATKKREPMGEVCITGAYGNLQTVAPKMFEKVRYSFDVSERLGLNVTFLTFSLSDMCVIDHPFRSGNCFYDKDTEYVLIDQGDPDPRNKPYFCFKRPQWSVYTSNTTLIDYYPCNVCNNFKSSIVFRYQIIDRGLIQTDSDIYRNILYGGHAWSTWRRRYYSLDKGAHVPYSSLCLSLLHFCSHQFLEFFVRGAKYERLSLMKTGAARQQVFVSEYFGASAVELRRPEVLSLNSFYCLIRVAVRTESDDTDALIYASWVESNVGKYVVLFLQ